MKPFDPWQTLGQFKARQEQLAAADRERRERKRQRGLEATRRYRARKKAERAAAQGSEA